MSQAEGPASVAPSVADAVIESLRERITAGVYPLGSRLPSERDLAQEFGVSRATVRQGILALEARGLLAVRDRSGAYVQAPTPDRVSDALLQLIGQFPHSITIRDLVEVRMVFEVEMAGLAAERRSREDLRLIARALADTAALADSVDAWAEADVEFHGALARATGNPLFAIIYDSLRSAFIEQRRRTGTSLPETRAAAFRWHQRIFDAVGLGDAVAARRAMHDHLLEARQTMLRYAAGELEGVPQPQRAPEPPTPTA